ncbi:unnamed protein product, partial [Enterobius vermicularis]|uniref:Choline O-acetyltransferase n=1 Tax=Enterobius vermicularis TaxID=51028 RepID=A0A0N4VF44_ENTVE
YASWLVRGFCDYKDKIDSLFVLCFNFCQQSRKQITRELSTGKNKVPMCMNQYERILRCYREPGLGIDVQHYDESSSTRMQEHVVAMCNKQAFVVYTRINGILLTQPEIEFQLQDAVRRSQNRAAESVIPISGGSVGNRDDAAKFWSLMKEVERNRSSLDWVKSAAFIVCLDVLQNNVRWPSDHEEYLTLAGLHLLTGLGSSVSGLNRWYDSAIQIVVASNGINGLCIEHSVAEGIVIINMSEYVLDYVQKNRFNYNVSETSAQISDDFLGTVEEKEREAKDFVLVVRKLIFDEKLTHQKCFFSLVNDLELCILEFKDFGKEFIKSKKYSPDGFVQLAMQLAHYRLHNKLVSTYESASIRRFRNGRVDNIRAATPEALLWVRSMMQSSSSAADFALKRKLFNNAMAKQVEITVENISGHGIDNHLCALEVLARKEYNFGDQTYMPELFKTPLWAELMRFPLTTSQVTTSPRFPGSYLCYGPVVRDGYGCSYNIQADSIIFAASACKTCPTTDAKRLPRSNAFLVCKPYDWYQQVHLNFQGKQLKISEMTKCKNSAEEETNNRSENGITLNWYEKPLPKLPVPPLKHTLERYLEYAQVLCDSDYKTLQRTKNAIISLEENEGKLLQRLDEAAETSVNWAKKFWLPAFYLKDRSPLPINASPAYVFPYRNLRKTNDFFRFTINNNYCKKIKNKLVSIKTFIDFTLRVRQEFLVTGKCHYVFLKKEIARDTSRRGNQMCMDQYDKMFRCYREPRIAEDLQHQKPLHAETADQHILVMCRNQAFILFTHRNGQPLKYAKIKSQLEAIEGLSRVQRSSAKELIGAGSAGYRNDAAKFWERLRCNPHNEKNFLLAKDANFVVCLDIEEVKQVQRDEPRSPAERGKHLLHGFGSKNFGVNRWYDATLQVIICTNGTSGLCIEHSVVEGIVLFRMADAALKYVENNINSNPELNSTEEKVLPQLLKWEFDLASSDLLKKQLQDFDRLADDLELYVVFFEDFGKNHIKSMKTSPDGFVQLAMQLAAYRWFGKLVSTYESASLREFAEGRVDNIRAATPEALKWVQAMNDRFVLKDRRKALFYEAAKKQALITFENVDGMGIDNHVIALYELSKLSVAMSERGQLPEFFTDSMWTKLMNFPLSTSQATQSTLFSDRYNFYGPMNEDGYGVPYNIQENYIIFTVSARISSGITSAKGFGENIRMSMLEIRDLIA